MTKYEVTNAICSAGIWESVWFDNYWFAKTLADDLNKKAKRGLRPFSEIVEH